VTFSVAQVIVDVRIHSVDRLFDYAVPATLIDVLQPGHRVLVPFGGRRVEGYVVRYPATSTLSDLKPIAKLLDAEPLLSPARMELAQWMSQRYLCLLAQAFHCWLPPGTALRSSTRAKPLYENLFSLTTDGETELILETLKRAPRQTEAFRWLIARGGSATSKEAAAAGVPVAALTALVDKGIARRTRRQVRRDPWSGRTWRKEDHPLSSDQGKVLARLRSALAAGSGQFVLHGVTGSGKTLVYLHAIASALQQDKSAIVLVPEISLTPQAVAAFKGWFGEQVAVLHSRLSVGERAEQWQAVAAGRAQVVLGARSAVFAPVSNLGLIVIDEEQENAYKQEEVPRYHARDIARARVEREGGLLVLGSATPSIESYSAALAGDYELLTLPNRVENKPLPTVNIIDMREELLAGNRTMFSRELQMQLHACLSRGEQALLFLNRRGFASFVLCRECGVTVKCEHCEVSLTFHEPQTLTCHYCASTRKFTSQCPRCNSPYLRPFGAGTQRVELEVQRLFPSAKTLRMDVDTTSRKGAHEAIWTAFSRGEADILVGTQMIAKGLHFPGVTLVGVMSADTSLHFPDFRAAERTFQLLTQVAGRAGRGSETGRVIIQTYSPEHYSIQAAQNHDYETFFRQELAYRRRVAYPPFTSLARILITSEDEEQAIREAMLLARSCTHDGVTVIGPAPAPLSRLKNRFRWHILLKGALSHILAAAQEAAEASRNAQSHIVIDVDPYSLL
jgi:primosomal protein N' (replication factor Y)